AAESSGYDAELDERLQGVRDRAVELGAARRSAMERIAELTRLREALETQAAAVEQLKKQARTAEKTAEKAQRAQETAEEAVHRAIRLNEAHHLREELVPGQLCPVCEQLVASPPKAKRAPGSEAATAALQAAR